MPQPGGLVHVRPRTIEVIVVMKFTWPLLFLVTQLPDIAAEPSKPGGEPRAIFREITIGKGDKKLKLGASLSDDVKPLFELSGAACYRLRKGVFGGAESIEVFVAKDGRVKSIFFGYSDGTDYAAKREAYQKTLGEPQKAEEREDRVQFARWEDANTAFELVRHGSCVRAAMYDCSPSK